MPQIIFLPEEIKSKIAAGEIIERPASVVKELIENALDAKATFIKIEVKGGGLKEISVYDDGEGMEAEDLRICYKPHTTSKIKKLSDLFRITTLGFRGEALSSIAQVSKLTIVSKKAEELLAYEIQVEYGKENFFKPSVLSKGTLVKVKDLFGNLPARKAFIKNPKTENLKTLEIIKGLSLTKPEIKWEVFLEDRKVLSWEGGTLKTLLTKITGIEEEPFREVYQEIPPYEIHLILTSTSKTFSHTRFLYTLVNGRLIKDERFQKMLFSIFKVFYGNLGFPAGIIKVKVPPHLIDVNVHPAKWEVRFKDEKKIYQALETSVEELFLSKKKYFYSSSVRKENLQIKEDLSLDTNFSTFRSFYREKPLESLFYSPVKTYLFKYLGQFLDTYLLVEHEKELYLIDQHALSERILFEELKEKLLKTPSQEFLIPLLLKLSERALETLEEKRSYLEEMGFEIDILDGKGAILRKAPAIFKEDIGEVLEKLLEENFFNPQDLNSEILKRYACLLARKKGDHLSEEEINFLLEKFFKLKAETCPHGRPLYFKISASEIESKLRRR
ncbi:MAG: DNA mismatch repair endonuclease MutL [Thermodesulfobacteriaceae bacterium]|nr:DNA mismatch repair endonuclease MutL [Thermodesulfobacteriaceae bacterium]MCX8041491.1 DNA mismatch repair endonuclease MutL [Thermodesulfobacteriaceae bacterium]MDW8135961.1 DNA mismatch repair endonuclease MutL [Thermodesulfobacterium sp.]